MRDQGPAYLLSCSMLKRLGERISRLWVLDPKRAKDAPWVKEHPVALSKEALIPASAMVTEVVAKRDVVESKHLYDEEDEATKYNRTNKLKLSATLTFDPVSHAMTDYTEYEVEGLESRCTHIPTPEWADDIEAIVKRDEELGLPPLAGRPAKVTSVQTIDAYPDA